MNTIYCLIETFAIISIQRGGERDSESLSIQENARNLLSRLVEIDEASIRCRVRDEESGHDVQTHDLQYVDRV